MPRSTTCSGRRLCRRLDRGRDQLRDFSVASGPSGPVEKFDEQAAHRLGLLLLYPVAGAVHEMRRDHFRARVLLHPLEGTWVLIHAPVALAADEHRRHVDRAAGKQLLLGGEAAARAGAIAFEAALETGASVLAAVDPQLRIRQPAI